MCLSRCMVHGLAVEVRMGGPGLDSARCRASRGKGHARHGKRDCPTDTRSVALAMWCWALCEQGTGRTQGARSKSTFDC